MKTPVLALGAAAARFVSVLSAPVANAAPTTRLTLQIASCDGCRVGMASYLQGSMDVWSAKPEKVADGKVSFAVPTDRTAGLSITVRAPWEGATGYVTDVALRYQGQQPGDKVGFTAARASTRASGCWAGTSDDTATMKVVVRKVQVDGYSGKVPGTLAFAKVTQDWLRPLVPTWRGVVGTQDVMPCKA